MRRRDRSVPHRLLTAVIGAVVALALVPGMGAAAKNPVSEVTGNLEESVNGLTGGSASAGAAEAPPEPTEDDDSEGHESPNPADPDHASGGIADAEIDGNELVTVGHTDSTITDDDSSSSDVTVLAIGGEEIVGAHSDSEDGPESDTQDPLAPVCEDSGGGVCLGLLFADASSSENAGSSNASSSAAVAFTCLGGTQTDSTEECDGPVSVGVAQSNGDIERDKQTGETEASHSSDLADVCIGGADASGTCTGVGAEAAHSESHSESGPAGGRGSTERDSFLLNVEANGEDNEVIGDPTAIAVPLGCPDSTSVACVFFNQGESFVFTGGAAGHQEVAHVQVGPDLVLGHLATSETLATNAGPDDVVEGDPPLENPGDTVLGGGPGAADDGSGDALPFTGAETSLLLAIAFALISAGAWLLALRRLPLAQPQQ
ncbi:MAG: hypothetical protein ACRDJT_06490 [Actinomycetota bacterium]